jgi:hypothetical protein
MPEGAKRRASTWAARSRARIAAAPRNCSQLSATFGISSQGSIVAADLDVVVDRAADAVRSAGAGDQHVFPVVGALGERRAGAGPVAVLVRDQVGRHGLAEEVDADRVSHHERLRVALVCGESRLVEHAAIEGLGVTRRGDAPFTRATSQGGAGEPEAHQQWDGNKAHFISAVRTRRRSHIARYVPPATWCN